MNVEATSTAPRAAHPGEHAPQGGPHGDHERTDAGIGPLLQFGIGLAVITTATFFAMKWFMDDLDRRIQADYPERPRMAPERQVPGEYVLQSGNLPLVREADLSEGPQLFSNEKLGEYESSIERVLTTYDWVDRQAQVVRVPVERAKELVLQKGLPVAAPGSGGR